MPVLAFYRGDFEQGLPLAEESVQLARVSADPRQLTNALNLLGTSLTSNARTQDATEAFEEAVRLGRDGGFIADLSSALVGPARELPPGESARAMAMVDEGLELATRIRRPQALAAAWEARGKIAARVGDWPTAPQADLDSAEQHLEVGDVVLGAASLRLAARAFRELGDLEAAAAAFGKADAISDGGFAPVGALDKYAAAKAALVEELGEQRVAELAARGAAMTLADVVAYLRVEVKRILAGDGELA